MLSSWKQRKQQRNQHPWGIKMKQWCANPKIRLRIISHKSRSNGGSWLNGVDWVIPQEYLLAIIRWKERPSTEVWRPCTYLLKLKENQWPPHICAGLSNELIVSVEQGKSVRFTRKIVQTACKHYKPCSCWLWKQCWTGSKSCKRLLRSAYSNWR